LREDVLADKSVRRRSRCAAWGGDLGHQEEKSSFLKKRSKRLFLFGVYARRRVCGKVQKFFGSFFQKRTVFAWPPGQPGLPPDDIPVDTATYARRREQRL
jgi:hypothetical protein